VTDVIDAIRGLRNQTLTFERVMSGLTVAIGDVERLENLEPDQIERLRAAVVRLSAAYTEHSGGNYA